MRKGFFDMFFYTNKIAKKYVDIKNDMKKLFDKLNLKKKWELKEELKKNRQFLETFFNIFDYKKNPGHYFLSKHCNDHQLLNFIENKFYGFAQSVSWYEDKITFTITEDETFLCIRADSYENWTWTETVDSIRLVCNIESYGFFDTSESKNYFNYIIRYLGETINKEDQEFVDNEKVYVSIPKIHGKSGSQRFIVENILGMKGFFEISWLVE